MVLLVAAAVWLLLLVVLVLRTAAALVLLTTAVCHPTANTREALCAYAAGQWDGSVTTWLCAAVVLLGCRVQGIESACVSCGAAFVVGAWAVCGCGVSEKCCCWAGVGELRDELNVVWN